MTRAERIVFSFTVVLNLFGFGMVFLVLSNGNSFDGITFIATGDAGFLALVAVAGFVTNLCLPWFLYRFVRRRKQDPHPIRITGE